MNGSTPAPYDLTLDAFVGVKWVDGRQLHAAIFYKDTSNSLRALHFCWHHNWRDQPAPTGYHWVRLGIPKSVALSLAALCREVARSHALGAMPFTFEKGAAKFDQTTGLVVGQDGRGFTCATFILAMLASLNVRLLDEASWPKRECDEAWQNEILKSCDFDHQKLLIAQVGSVRFRPEEVVASAAQVKRPVPFAVALPEGRKMLSDMSASDLACWYDGAHGSTHATRRRRLRTL